jgi:hypothetical protein
MRKILEVVKLGWQYRTALYIYIYIYIHTHTGRIFIALKIQWYICWVKSWVLEVTSMITEIPLQLPGSMTEVKVCVWSSSTRCEVEWVWHLYSLLSAATWRALCFREQYCWSARNSHELKSHEQSFIISNQLQCELIVSTLGLFRPYERWDLSGQNSMLEAHSSSLQEHAFSQPEVG